MKLRTALALTAATAALTACGATQSGSAKPASSDSFVQPGPGTASASAPSYDPIQPGAGGSLVEWPF